MNSTFLNIGYAIKIEFPSKGIINPMDLDDPMKLDEIIKKLTMYKQKATLNQMIQ